MKQALLAFVLGFSLVYVIHTAWGHDHNRPELDKWFQELRRPNGVSCCEGSEAKHVEDADWDSDNGHYKVRLDGQWVEVPDEAVVKEPNLAGPTLVWPRNINGTIYIMCFLPGSMT